MMVSISGERGVGKTLHLADRVYQRRMQGYFTVTNFSHSHSNLDCSGLSPEEFLDVILNIIDFKDNGYEMFNLHPSFRHTGVYIAMDEATIYFSPEMQSRLAKSNPAKYERLLNLLAQARKYDVEIDYVVQDPAKVGKDFRRYTEYYKRFRWVFKLKRMAFIEHPRLPIFRREHRHLLDVIWEEIHELDTENPVFNYRTVRDENGVAQWAENTTLKERHLRLTGRYKRHILRMYNSYQPVAVKQQEYRKEFSPLKNFSIIPTAFKRERIPTLKAIVRFFGIPWKNTDAKLPPKIRYEDLILPPKDERNKIISEVQVQEVITLSTDDLQKAIARAYGIKPEVKPLETPPVVRTKTVPAKGQISKIPEKKTSWLGSFLKGADTPLKKQPMPIPAPPRPVDDKPFKYVKKNDPKVLLKESMIINQNPADVSTPKKRRGPRKPPTLTSPTTV